ncbi:carboxymuconolactone decarboxylase family protein [Nocardia brasiliensis]|uniref:Carboxymuconolactone decarboxylase family protein n=1 Tax=Nocardia brasiliensis TaxID=37326 RepID=A0A6G9XRI4_NOCBR|nr:carboxymuconolactone decarboxylase family protein [Nocardia brasiliensis]QIS03516.1 carboxymuconolactone decarboxylase family protein [Nocardia brasiliensis]
MSTTASHPRIAPLRPPYAPDIAAQLAKWMPRETAIEPLALFRTLAVHDELFARMRPLGAGILGHGRVPPRDREIVILRTCARARAEYEWGIHAVLQAPEVGLTPAQIDATAVGTPADPAWSSEETALVRLADEIHETASLSDELWLELHARYRDDQVLELVTIAGWYRLLCSLINAAQVPHETWARRFPVAPRV